MRRRRAFGPKGRGGWIHPRPVWKDACAALVGAGEILALARALRRVSWYASRPGRPGKRRCSGSLQRTARCRSLMRFRSWRLHVRGTLPVGRGLTRAVRQRPLQVRARRFADAAGCEQFSPAGPHLRRASEVLLPIHRDPARAHHLRGTCQELGSKQVSLPEGFSRRSPAPHPISGCFARACDRRPICWHRRESRSLRLRSTRGSRVCRTSSEVFARNSRNRRASPRPRMTLRRTWEVHPSGARLEGPVLELSWMASGPASWRDRP